MTSPAVAESVPARQLHDAIKALGVTHILTVPDTHQKTLLASLRADRDLEFVTLSTEDEAICVNAGLWMGGAQPLVIIQNVGLFASMNSLRGIAMDMRIPTCLLTGQYGRDVTRPVEENRNSAVRLIEGVMESMDVPTCRIDKPDDVPQLAKGFAESRERRGPVVVLVGAPTA
jgi:sulfopyruvate decarboxylase TPP-binding subunit